MHQALVIEDQDLMRLALIQELKSVLTECVMLGAPTLKIANNLLENEEVDLVVIDPGLPGFNPTSRSDRLSVVEGIIEASPSAIHVVVTGSDSHEEAEHCRRLGAAGYVSKTGLIRGLLAEVLQDVSRDGFSVRLSDTRQLTADFHYPGMTAREQEILDCMRRRERGMKRKEIYEQMGERFGIDPATVEKYYKQARAKLLKHGQLPKGF
ncbi:response regulator transcription factor [Mesorhizobium sp. BHbsci]